MSVALELRAAARAAGRSTSFVPTGQTGMMIEGWGAAVDRLISDFAQGTVEWMVEEGEARGDWVIVEGQGSLDHPAYSLGHARPDPRRDAARDGPRPQGRPDRARLRPPARRVVPDRRPAARSSTLHERVAGLVAPSKVVAIALNTSAIASADDARAEIARVAAADRAAGRRPRPVRRPVRCGPGSSTRSTRCRGSRRSCSVTLDLRPEVLHLAPARPVPDRPLRSRRGPCRHDGRGRAPRRPLPGRHVGLGEGYPDRFYGETVETMAAVLSAPARRRSAHVDPTRATACVAAGRADARRRSPTTAAAKCALDIALHDLVGKRQRSPDRRPARPPRRDPADRLHARHRRARGRRRAGRPGGRASRPSRSSAAARPTSRRSRPSGRSSTGRSGSTPTPAGSRTTPSRLLPELERLGVELIEQPFPAHRLDQLRWLQERSSLPIVADESAVTIDDLEALVGVVAGVNVKLAKCGGVGPARADAGARARARLPDVPRLHGGDVGRRSRRRRPSRRWPTGSTSTATCCSPTTRSTGLELGDDCRWRLAGRARALRRPPPARIS